MKHTYHGEDIYPKILIEPHRDIIAMEAIEWLDLQTETVTLSTMVYTEGIEIFTSLSVIFKIDEAGNVDGSYVMISYRDMINGSKNAFIALLGHMRPGRICWGGLLALLHLDAPKGVQMGLCSIRAVLTWCTPLIPHYLVAMAEEFDHLLHSFLDMESLEEQVMEDIIQKYFDTKSHIYSETSWMKSHRVVAYMVCYIQFLQLIFYFNAHPKMAVLTAT
eukprot:CAMPEP_0179185436 /NCGR_PEP_ID=MMETSP0796-20121207/91952_1 /TAXON_ID=73915 /ORGANISM="Pyrodinium bahamense, Strain pbaha01" /LENGTH=218 /DNA_ID=CAMNT_0020889393 /DNA_START=208 /DNA_END=859 /DNA_ORIENTATION=-